MTRTESQPGTPRRPEAVQLRARRSPQLVATGVLAVVLGGAGSAYLWASSHDHRAVLATTTDITRGTVLTDAHLEVLHVPAAFTDRTLEADGRDSLLGQTTLTDLPRGAFPLPHHVGEDPLPDGESLVGLRLLHGRLPTATLPPGSRVRLVGTGEERADIPAVIASVPTLLDDGVTFVVDVRVPADSASGAARMAARDELAVVATEVG